MQYICSKTGDEGSIYAAKTGMRACSIYAEKTGMRLVYMYAAKTEMRAYNNNNMRNSIINSKKGYMLLLLHAISCLAALHYIY